MKVLDDLAHISPLMANDNGGRKHELNSHCHFTHLQHCSASDRHWREADRSLSITVVSGSFSLNQRDRSVQALRVITSKLVNSRTALGTEQTGRQQRGGLMCSSSRLVVISRQSPCAAAAASSPLWYFTAFQE